MGHTEISSSMTSCSVRAFLHDDYRNLRYFKYALQRLRTDPGTVLFHHLVTEGCQVGRRLLPHGADLGGRHQSEDVLDGGGSVGPELIPEGVVCGFDRLRGGDMKCAAAISTNKPHI